jgi:hypothetical protein
VGLAAAGVADVVAVGVVRTPPFFMSPPPQPVTAAPSFYYDGPGLAAPIDQPRQNRGQLTCWALEEWGRGGAHALWSGDRPQAHGPGLEWVERTPDSFRFIVDAAVPATIAINTHFDPGWRTDTGTLESRGGGGLHLRLPAGRHDVHLRYRPRGLTAGALISFVGLVGATIFLWRRPRTRVEPGLPALRAPAA